VNCPAWPTTAIAEQNDPLGVNTAIIVSCTPGAGSGFDRLVNPGSGLIGVPYNPGNCVGGAASTLNPVGISMNGGQGPVLAAGWRNFVNTHGHKLQPEKAMNWAVGGEFAPTTFLKGLDIQATWYSVKLTGLLAGFGNPQSSTVNDSNRGFAYIVPTDLAYLHTAPAICSVITTIRRAIWRRDHAATRAARNSSKWSSACSPIRAIRCRWQNRPKSLAQ
jgi:hypothetical protein